MEQLMFNDVSFNNVTVLLNNESVKLLTSDMMEQATFPVAIISDVNNETFKDIVRGAPVDLDGKVTAIVFSVTFKENFKT